MNYAIYNKFKIVDEIADISDEDNQNDQKFNKKLKALNKLLVKDDRNKTSDKIYAIL
jgi:hypothetical protein